MDTTREAVRRGETQRAQTLRYFTRRLKRSQVGDETRFGGGVSVVTEIVEQIQAEPVYRIVTPRGPSGWRVCQADIAAKMAQKAAAVGGRS